MDETDAERGIDYELYSRAVTRYLRATHEAFCRARDIVPGHPGDRYDAPEEQRDALIAAAEAMSHGWDTERAFREMHEARDVMESYDRNIAGAPGGGSRLGAEQGQPRALRDRTKARLEELRQGSATPEQLQAIGRVYIWALLADTQLQAEAWYRYAKSMLDKNQFHLVPKPPKVPAQGENGVVATDQLLAALRQHYRRLRGRYLTTLAVHRRSARIDARLRDALEATLRARAQYWQLAAVLRRMGA